MNGMVSSVLVLVGGLASFICAFMADRRPQVLALLVVSGGALLDLTSAGVASAVVTAALGWRMLTGQIRKDTERYRPLK